MELASSVSQRTPLVQVKMAQPQSGVSTMQRRELQQDIVASDQPSVKLPKTQQTATPHHALP